MRRLQVPVILLVGSALIFLMTGCGGGSGNTTSTAVKVTISPVALSMNRGEVLSSAFTVTATDAKNANVTAEYIFTANNSSLVSVSPAGAVCAGKWDTNFVVCTPATTSGVATITATITNNTSVFGTLTVYVHAKVDRVQMDPTASSCLSSGQQEQLTATAYSTDPAVCTSLGSSAPCALPNASLGQFTFSTADIDVVSIDNTTVPGNATGKGPGSTTVTASVSNVNSPAQPFLVCPITQLTFTNGTDTSPITLAKAGTQTMNVTAVDSAGVTLTSPPISYFTSSAYSMNLVGAGTASTATATGVNSGTSALLIAACVPPTCNKNLNAVFAPGIMATVSGSYTAPIVYAASTKSLSLIPVDTSNNSAGTAVTLPYLPNSLLLNHQGTAGVMGSDNNPLMIISTAGPTIATIAGVTNAKALAVSQDGTFALVSNPSGTYILNMTTSAITLTTTFGGATKAAFSPDSKYAFFTRGTSTLYAIDLTASRLLIYNEGTTIIDIAVSGNGSLTYLAQAGAIQAIGNCNLQNPGFADTQPATAPSILTSMPNGGGVIGIDGTNLLLVKLASASEACPPAVSESLTTLPLGFASSPKQALVTPDGKFGVVPGPSTQVAIANLSSAFLAKATLSGTATVAGQADVTADSLTAYVGGSDNAIHKIDLSTAADTAQISVSLKDSSSNVVAPDLIAVRNK